MKCLPKVRKEMIVTSIVQVVLGVKVQLGILATRQHRLTCKMKSLVNGCVLAGYLDHLLCRHRTDKGGQGLKFRPSQHCLYAYHRLVNILH